MKPPRMVYPYISSRDNLDTDHLCKKSSQLRISARQMRECDKNHQVSMSNSPSIYTESSPTILAGNGKA